VSSSGSAAVDSVTVDACDSVVLVCGPPLLLMDTPDDTCVLEDVVPDIAVVSVVAVPVPADDDPLADVESPPVVGALDEVDDSPVDVLLDVESAELDEEDDSDVPVVSAAATP
jgi:hypothetical protein